MLAGLFLLQAVAGPPLPPELRKRVARATMPCPVQTDPYVEIVVCARPTDQRLAKLRSAVVPPARGRQGQRPRDSYRTARCGRAGGRGNAEDAVRQGEAGVARTPPSVILTKVRTQSQTGQCSVPWVLTFVRMTEGEGQPPTASVRTPDTPCSPGSRSSPRSTAFLGCHRGSSRSRPGSHHNSQPTHGEYTQSS
jgi:hypothetical protein